MRAASLFVAGATVVFGLISGTAAQADGVSYSAQVQPIFDQNCVICHAKGAESGGLNLTKRKSWKSLVGAKSTEAPLDRVAPSDLAKSYLIHKLDGSFVAVGGNGDQMPKMDIPRQLDPADMTLITQWISEGAPNN